MPVPYRAAGLAGTCRVPAWADGSYYLEADPRCVLIIAAGDGTPCWLSYAALATAGPAPPPAVDFYTLVQLQPVQIDLFDERRGWGTRATLELAPGDERNKA